MVTDRSYTGRSMPMQTTLVAVANCKFTKAFSREIKLLNSIVHGMALQPSHLGKKTNNKSCLSVCCYEYHDHPEGYHGYS